MNKPQHPGEFIWEVYPEPFALTGRQLWLTIGLNLNGWLILLIRKVFGIFFYL